jgi:hypothetical protein
LIWINAARGDDRQRPLMTLSQLRTLNRALLCALVVLYAGLAIWLVTLF